MFDVYSGQIWDSNNFLPKGDEITLEDEPSPLKKAVQLEVATNFLYKIKTRFQGDDRVYKSFLDILVKYTKENNTYKNVYEEVAALFGKHSDLLAEFTHFLPDTQAAAPVHNAQPGWNSTLRRDVRGPPMTMARPMHFEKSVSRPDQDHEKILMNSGKEQRRRLKEEEREQDYEGINAQELALREKVKERLLSSDKYKEYLRCLHVYKENIITRGEMQTLVGCILERHPDLMDEFNELFVRDRTEPLCNDGEISRLLKVDDRGRDREWGREEREIERHISDRDALILIDFAEKMMSSYESKNKFWQKQFVNLTFLHVSTALPVTDSFQRIIQFP